MPRWLPCLLMAAALSAEAQPGEPMIPFTVTERDTLIGLSETVLVSPEAWKEVARLNRLRNANRIRPGQTLQIPERLMRSTPLPAKLVGAFGDVRVGGAPVQAGANLAQGESVETGTNGSAVVEMADGSRFKLPPSSLAQVVASRTYGAPGVNQADASPSRGWFSGALRLIRGSVEVFATQVLRAKPLELTTPTAVVGVRGTQYRVNFDEAANASTRTEVLEGRVRFDTASGTQGADVKLGFGAIVDASAAAPSVVPLLPAPDLSALPKRFERPLVRFAVAGEANTLRWQVAADPAFEKVVSDQLVAPGVELRLAGLEDATWHLRARRLDTRGIAGFDAATSFVLKARPEPPGLGAPRSGAKQSVGPVQFAWSMNVEAQRTHLQVSRDAAFSSLLLERDDVTAASEQAVIDVPGTYFWRMASIRASGDRGPFGDAQRFELRPLPEPPTGGASADGKSLELRWSGRPEDRQQVQLASDADFKQVVANAELANPQWLLSAPTVGGTYFFRYRSIEPDGFVSPYSSALKIEVPQDWRFLWLLLPLLFVL